MNHLICLSLFFASLIRTITAFIVPKGDTSVQPFLAKEFTSPETYIRHVAAFSFSKSSELSEVSSCGKEAGLLLDEALNSNEEAVSKLLDEVRSLREKDLQELLAAFLDEILKLVDEDKPVWTNLKISARLSKRSRRASLHRLLNMSTPSSSDDDIDAKDAKQSRRRRALVVALRALVTDDPTSGKRTGVPIRQIEKAARRDIKEKSTAQDMEDRLPPGLETPKYDVIVKRRNFELRNYEGFSVCSVKMNKPRPDSSKTDRKLSQPQLPGASSFGALAGYLFGKNKDQISMKMTTPVLTSGEGDDKEMAFVLPSSYWGEESLLKAPLPLDNSLVQLKRDNGGQRAVVMFSGFANVKDVALKKKELISSLEDDKNWDILPNANFTVAQYNDPFTPPWKRRNEISIPVQSKM
jgi:hypothetical protein